ncbi:unnamed protein product [Nesidiocoris tenuis]|uniref:E3 UFM1-protein ligase 1-like N-terminal domain-containing protein n=1 Tax=Nesidiocoris tenuis TaxID=355587 RepID=A0A6H5HK71_9HEMI|nr:unnamed protein product [Nesidiocoris tenuis]
MRGDEEKDKDGGKSKEPVERERGYGLLLLPFLLSIQVVEKNLGKSIHGKQDKSDSRIFYTEAFVERNMCILRGALRAITQPIQVNVLAGLTELQDRDFFCELPLKLCYNLHCCNFNSFVIRLHDF